MVERKRFASASDRRSRETTPVSSDTRRRFARIPNRRRQTTTTVTETQEQALQRAIKQELSKVDQQIEFQRQVISNIEAVIAQRNSELVTAEGDRARLLTDRNDRDRDRINDVNRTIQNLQNQRVLVERGDVSADSLIVQSKVIAEGSAETRRKVSSGEQLSQQKQIRLKTALDKFKQGEITLSQLNTTFDRAGVTRPLITQETVKEPQELSIPKTTPDLIFIPPANLGEALQRGFENFRGEGSLTGNIEKLRLEAEVSKFEGRTAGFEVVDGVIQVPQDKFADIQLQQEKVIEAQKAFENTFLQKRIKDFSGFNLQIKEKVTDPLIFDPLAKIGITDKSIGKATEEALGITSTAAFTLTGVKPTDKLFKATVETPPAQFAAGTAEGIFVDVRDKPLKQIGLVGVGAGIGAGLKLGSATVVSVGGVIGGVKGANIAGTLATVGLTGTGVVLASKAAKDISTKVRSAEGARQVGSVVGIAAKDLTLVGIGARGGQKAADKLIGRLSTRGLKEVDINKLSPNRAKESQFPKIKRGESAKELAKRFEQPRLPGEKAGTPRSFTATDIRALAKAQKIPIGAKRGKTIKSEFPGRFGADVPSENFLRLAREGDFKLLGLDKAGGLPSLVRTTLQKIRTPKSLGGKLAGGKTLSQVPLARKIELTRLLGGIRGQPFKQIQTQTPLLKSGQAVTPFIKLEREIILPFTTKFSKPTARFFVKVDGVRIPIFENIAISSTTPTTNIATASRFESFITSSSSTPTTSSFITPIKFAAATTSVGDSSASTLPPITSRSLVTSRARSSTTRVSSSIPISTTRSIPTLRSSSITSTSSSITTITPGSSITRIPRTPDKTKTTKPVGFELKGKAPSKLQTGDFITQIRRQGQFRTIARAPTARRAFDIGLERVDKTLAATFRIKGKGKLLKDLVPSKKVKRKKGKRLTFIELPKFRLDTPSEVREIKLAKGRLKL